MRLFSRTRKDEVLDSREDDVGEYSRVQMKELEPRYPDPDDEDDDNNEVGGRLATADEMEVEKHEQTHSVMPKWKRFTTYNSSIKSYCIAALPRFCQPGGLKNKRKLHPTSYLDALRGYAAWIVFMYHSFNTYDPSWRRQPFISFIFAGNGMVALFFVLSGYVLSYRILKHIRMREAIPVFESLVSSLFRRFLRLYGSTIFSLIIAFVMLRLGLNIGLAVRLPSFFDQLAHFCLDTFLFINPFADVRGYFTPEVYYSKYLGQMWTIPVEFRGSVMLFSYLAAVCKLSTRSRMCLTWVIIILSYAWAVVYAAMFFMGMFLADVSLGRSLPTRCLSLSSHEPTEGTDTLPTHSQAMSLSDTPSPRRQPLYSKIIYSIIFIIAIFLLGQPDHTELGVWGDFPWLFLKSFIPSYYGFSPGIFFWLSIGSFLLVLSLDSFRPLQVPLEWGFSQYVGELSFGIYALHPPLTFSFLRGFADPMQIKYLGTSPWAYLPGFIVMNLLVFTAADYFSRVDKKVVAAGRWLQNKAFRW